MRSRPIIEKSGLARMGISLAVLVAVAIAIIAFILIVSPVPHSTADVADRSAPDTVPAGNTTGDSPAPDSNGGLLPDIGAARAAKHIGYAYQSNVSGITVFTAYWNVPDRPVYDEYIKHTVFLWSGLQQGNLGLIQSVLEWDHDDTDKYWTIACWIVNRKDGTYEVSRRFKAYPGDRIRADLRYITDPGNPGEKVWFIAITDETQQSMTYLVDYRGAVDTNQNLTVFSGVLEGIGLVRYDNDLPGDVTFENIIYRAEGNINVPVNLTGYVHPDMRQVAVEYENDTTGTPVIIHTHYNG